MRYLDYGKATLDQYQKALAANGGQTNGPSPAQRN